MWTYIEVTQPDFSEGHERADAISKRTLDFIMPIKKSFGLEVALHREPSESEIEALRDQVQEFCQAEGVQAKELPGLGKLFLNQSKPGQIELVAHEETGRVPHVFAAQAVYGPNEPHRHIVVHIPVTDGRGDDFLRREARQLPPDAPGLIMIQVSRVPGGFNSTARPGFPGQRCS